MSRRTDSSALRYAFREIDLQKKRDARTQQVLMVGTRKKVLEIGPASGYITKALRKRGCTVTCVEVDPRAARAAREYANRMINADIETMNFEKELGEERYDVILFGDVLEHLKDPKAVLSGLRPYLKPSGYVVATAPNVAHGSVRLLLLDGKFDPQATGILDWTHLHFYTRRTLLELFRDAGYTVELVEEIKEPISAAENIRINLKEYPAELIRAIESDPNSTAYEFALVAKPATGSVSQRIPSQRRLVSHQLGSRRYDPLSTLLYLYLTRSDLRAAFPEVQKGNYRRLLEWANNTIENRADNAHRLLRRCAYWYRNNPISSEPEFRREHEALEEELRNQKKHATNLEEERKALAEHTQALVTELALTRETLRNERDVLRNELARTLSEKDGLSSNLKHARAELDIIKSSSGYKFMRFYSTRIDHLFPEGTKRGDFRKTVVKSVRIATSQGTRHLFRLALRKLRRRDASVSVVILTRSPPADFELSLERLRSQKSIPDPEIVVINSGTCDLESLAKRYRLKLHNISPEEFDHAKTRNLAAKNASGEFIVFLTDDAIPAKDDLIFNMIRTLTADTSIAAVTARQIPRSDADFMYCQAMWWHYRALGIATDRIVGSKEFDALTPEQRRAICQIDDVCSCFRRDRFLRYKYEKGYAEDLGLGIRLAKDGFRIAQLFSTGVIHSHARPPSYYLKRGFVDFKALNRLLDYETLDFNAWSVESVHDLLDLILRLDRSLVYVIDHLQAASFCQFDIQRTFDMVENLIHNVPDDAAEARAENTDLSMILSQIAEVVQYRGGRRSHGPNLLIGNYLGALEIFREWLSNSHQDLRNIETYFVDALYKLLALQVGNVLAHYVVHTRRAGQESERIMRLDRLLSEGI